MVFVTLLVMMLVNELKVVLVGVVCVVVKVMLL
jgi:hypothetical protein